MRDGGVFIVRGVHHGGLQLREQLLDDWQVSGFGGFS